MAKNARVSRLPVMASHMSTQEKSKRIESLYVLKAICAFFVITIHLPTFQKILVPIAGVGTPCFLCITGYLLYSASKERELEKCISWAAKSFWLAVVFNIIYVLANTFIFGIEMAWMDWRFYIKLLVLGTGASPYLWYLTALFEALLILYVIIRYAPKLMSFLPLLFIIALVMRNLEACVPEFEFPGNIHPIVIRNSCIITSLPFLATGYLLRKHEEWLLKVVNFGYALPITIVLLIAEYYLRGQIPKNYFLLGSYPLVVLLMLLCIKHKDFTIPVLGGIGKNHSPNIYYFHGLYIMFLEEVDVYNQNAYLLALGVYIACLPCSFVYNWLSQKWKLHVWGPFCHRLSYLVKPRRLNI